MCLHDARPAACHGLSFHSNATHLRDARRLNRSHGEDFTQPARAAFHACSLRQV